MNRLALSAFALLFVTQVAANDDSPRPTIVNVTNVVFYATDMPATARFYRELLSPPADCSWCNPVFPRPGLSIPLAFDSFGMETVTLRPLSGPLPSSLLYEVDLGTTATLEETKQYLVEHDVAIEQDASPRDHRLIVRDPEGRRIGFVSEKHRPEGIGSPVLTATPLRIIHAGFIVHDRAATEHFYKDILGFRPYWHGGMKDDQTDWVSMQVPDGTDWLEMMVNVSPDADQRVRGIMNHIAIGVTDIHAAQQKLIANGVKLTEEPKIGRDGKWQLNVYDPDQTRVEFMEFTPVQKPCCSDFTGPHPHP